MLLREITIFTKRLLSKSLRTLRSCHVGMMQNYEQLVFCVLSRVLTKLGADLCKITVNSIAPDSDQFYSKFWRYLLFLW